MKEENTLIVLEEVKYPVSLDEIMMFKAKWENVPELDATAGVKDPKFLEVREAHLQAVKYRTSIEKKRKVIVEPALTYQREANKIAKEFTEILQDTEVSLFAERNKVEQYEKRQEQERIDRERERVELISTKVTALQAIPGDAIGKSVADLKEIYESVVIPGQDVYQERTEEAVFLYKETMEKLEGMIAQAEMAEQAQAQMAEQEEKRKKEDAERQAKFEEEKKELQKEREAFEAEKKAKEEAESMERAKAEAKALAEEQEAERVKQIAQAQEAKAIEGEKQKAYEDETLKVMGDYLEDTDLLRAIIGGNVPHVRWEV